MDSLEMLNGDVDDGSTQTAGMQAQARLQNKKRCYADSGLDLPPIPREEHVFSGLRNQGATCYLNSLFQTFYMCPELRTFFYKLDLEKIDAYQAGTDKYNIIRQFQLLIGKLRYLDFKNHDTLAVTASFGWAGGEGSQQQDVAEAMRVIFDTLEKCFFESGYSDEFTKIFK